MKLECCNNKHVFSCKKLSTPENPAVLENPPTRTNEDVINLLSYYSDIAIPSPVVLFWSLIPRPYNSRPFVFCKIQKERAVSVPGTRAMETNT